MAMPVNKQQLLEYAQNQYALLLDVVHTLSADQRDTEHVFDNRTTKDIIAHLYAWQVLELDWYTQGMAGKKPAIPAPGYTFADAPALNEKLFQEYKNTSWDTVNTQLLKSHKKLIKIIEGHTEDELFTKKKYAWTGSTSMAIYFRSALSSHYVWAYTLIRKHFKQTRLNKK